jgi:hypothetical protein
MVDTKPSDVSEQPLVDKGLADAICDAFNRAELKVFVGETMGRRFCDRISGWDSGKDVLVYNLLDLARRDGSLRLRKLLTELENWEDKRTSEDLHNAVAAALARLSGGKSTTNDVRVAVASIEKQVEQDEVIRGVVRESRDNLNALSVSISVLYRYKTLHDCLQRIQIEHYRAIINCARELGVNPQVSFELRERIIALTKLCIEARRAAELLPEIGADRAQMLRSVEEIESAIPRMKEALRAKDAQLALAAFSPLRNVILYQQICVNTLLNRLLEELPIGKLRDIIESVATAKSVSETSARDLQQAIVSLDKIEANLKDRAAEHDRWQRIEQDFWEAEGMIEQRTLVSLAPFKDRWSAIKFNVDKIAAGQAQSDWVRDSKEYSGQIDKLISESLTINSSNVELVRENFRLYRENALYRFFEVNLDLKSQGEEILRIRQPLQRLLEKV